MIWGVVQQSRTYHLSVENDDNTMTLAFFSTKIFGQSQLLDAKTEDFSNLKWRCTW